MPVLTAVGGCFCFNKHNRKGECIISIYSKLLIIHSSFSLFSLWRLSCIVFQLSGGQIFGCPLVVCFSIFDSRACASHTSAALPPSKKNPRRREARGRGPPCRPRRGPRRRARAGGGAGARVGGAAPGTEVVWGCRKRESADRVGVKSQVSQVILSTG